MLISIIIPVYNAEKYICECLDSILSQSFTDFELLLIDDGSKDRSGEICDEYAMKDSRVRVFHKENGGASAARNMGLDNANGEWVSFVDSDDFVEPSYLETLSKIQDKADITFFPIKKISVNGDALELIPEACKVYGREEVERQLAYLKYGKLGDLFGWTHDKLFKADIIRKHGIRFPEDVVYREDEIFTLVYSRYIDSVEIIETPLYNYRVVPTGLTANGMKDSDFIAVSDYLLENLQYFRNEQMLSGDKQRIVDYRIEHALRTVSFGSMTKKCRPLYDFVQQHKDLMPFSRNQMLMRTIKYCPFLLVCIFIYVKKSLMSIWRKKY